MKDNAYDDPRFFRACRRMRENPQSANELIEQPAYEGLVCLPLDDLEVWSSGAGWGTSRST